MHQRERGNVRYPGADKAFNQTWRWRKRVCLQQADREESELVMKCWEVYSGRDEPACSSLSPRVWILPALKLKTINCYPGQKKHIYLVFTANGFPLVEEEERHFFQSEGAVFGVSMHRVRNHFCLHCRPAATQVFITALTDGFCLLIGFFMGETKRQNLWIEPLQVNVLQD